jgi:hypothetical protein
MPNNASARRGKEKKNKDKEKKGDKRTDTPSLPKEDTAGMDSGTLSISSAGKDHASRDKADTLSLEGMGVELDLSDPCYLEKAHAARQKDKAITKDGSSLSFVGTKRAANIAAPNLSDSALLKRAANIAAPNLSDSALLLEFARSLTDRENWDIHEDVRKANPGLSEKEFCEVKRAVMLKKAHEAR